MAGYDGTAGVYVFNGTTISGPTIVTTGPYASAWAARFNPAGNLLAIGTDEGYRPLLEHPAGVDDADRQPIDVAVSTVTGSRSRRRERTWPLAFDFETDILNVSTRALVSRAQRRCRDYVDSRFAFSASGGALIWARTAAAASSSAPTDGRRHDMFRAPLTTGCL